MDFAKCRPVHKGGKAVVLWEVMGICTTGTAGVWVQTREERFAEITLGRAIIQQGFATTCIDLLYKGKTRDRERILVWRMSQ